MLLNNLDPEVAERPEELVVYGGSGKAARSPEALRALVRSLLELGEDETLLVQSGKPVGVFRIVYPPERTAIALDRFFTESNLTALRELSLRFVAGRVDAQLEGIGTPIVSQPVTRARAGPCRRLRRNAPRDPSGGRCRGGAPRPTPGGRRRHARRLGHFVGAGAPPSRAPGRRGRPRRGSPEHRGRGPGRGHRRAGAPPAGHPAGVAVSHQGDPERCARRRSPSGSCSGCPRWRSRSSPPRRARPTLIASDGGIDPDTPYPSVLPRVPQSTAWPPTTPLIRSSSQRAGPYPEYPRGPRPPKRA